MPGSTIGVLGSGQLGRMFALAARELGYRILIYSPDNDTPAGQIGDQEFAYAYEDLDRIREFARQVQVVTFEFENVPAASTAAAAEFVPVRPDGRVLHVTQNRLREKTFLDGNGFPVTPFRRIKTRADLNEAVAGLGLPAVLKTADFGYDGKGQIKLTAADQLDAAWNGLRGAEGIYEAWVSFAQEISVVGARTLRGEFAAFPVFSNTHVDHILDVTIAPAPLETRLEKQAVDLASGILAKLDVVGLLTVEMFVTTNGQLLVNELAPRTHNSGHLTIDACVTSQFEQQVRAVCGLPLGSTALRQPAAAMANLLGHLWAKGEPNWVAALEDPQVKLHLYGKAQARIGRKMGHLTITGTTTQDCVERVLRARERLGQGREP
ncbi:MAG TPA: 5-(carboxyamino)imidazole ribonucleotide synthase [Verrucomicrobiae bacterium]|nr:5-(carboxyamino)imidazole ribonucleotide synthase [Verrucomicrobiae bacterium]